MEWVETTGRTVQEAKEAALDELGVDEVDAEFEVVAEAQTGLFGRLRSEARVRARVRPTAPRAKDDRRNRDRKRRAGSGGSTPGGGSGGSAAGGDVESRPQERTEVESPDAASISTRGSADATGSSGTDASDDQTEGGRRRRRRGGSRPGASPSARERADAERGGDDDEHSAKGPEVEVDLNRQAEVATEFLNQLTAVFGLSATVTLARPDEDTVELQLAGSDLGILIGPKGATLLALQNLTRTVVFNQTGGSNGHINVDVGGYRQKRTEALIRFAQQVAEQVKSTSNRTALEPMSAVDRKIVHDTISAIEGVNTVSEGEEPRRRVVVLPG